MSKAKGKTAKAVTTTASTEPTVVEMPAVKKSAKTKPVKVTDGEPLSASDTIAFERPVQIVTTSRGDIRLVPVGNTENATLHYFDVPAGFIPPYLVLMVKETGTTAKFKAAE